MGSSTSSNDVGKSSVIEQPTELEMSNDMSREHYVRTSSKAQSNRCYCSHNTAASKRRFSTL
jgi:hypothetical protein